MNIGYQNEYASTCKLSITLALTLTLSIMCRNWNQEPNAWGGNEDCAAILPDYTWNDEDCTLSFQYICEYPNLNQGTQLFCSIYTFVCYYKLYLLYEIVFKIIFSLTFNEKGIKTCQNLSMYITSFNINHIAIDKTFKSLI